VQFVPISTPLSTDLNAEFISCESAINPVPLVVNIVPVCTFVGSGAKVVVMNDEALIGSFKPLSGVLNEKEYVALLVLLLLVAPTP